LTFTKIIHHLLASKHPQEDNIENGKREKVKGNRKDKNREREREREKLTCVGG
jgi:hypothetical protein